MSKDVSNHREFYTPGLTFYQAQVQRHSGLTPVIIPAESNYTSHALHIWNAQDLYYHKILVIRPVFTEKIGF
jgi:hypothetical protein